VLQAIAASAGGQRVANFRGVLRRIRSDSVSARVRCRSGLVARIECLMHKQPNVQTLGEAIERWLRLQLNDTADWDQSLLLQAIAVEAPSQRLQVLHHVLRRSPDLAAKAAGIGLPEQLRLSLELVGQPLALTGPQAVASTAQFGRCRAMRRHRRPTRH